MRSRESTAHDVTHLRAGAAASLALAAVLAAGIAAAAATSRAATPAASTLTVVADVPHGRFAEQNRAIIEGATVAVAGIAAADGVMGRVKVKLVRRTLEGLSPAALRKRLVAAGADVLVVPCATDTKIAEAGAAAHILMLAPCNPDPALARRLPTYWPIGAGANAEAAGLAQFIVQSGYKSILAVSAPGDKLATYFDRAASGVRLRLAGRATATGGGAQADSVAKAFRISKTPSAILVTVPPPGAYQLVRDLRARGIAQPIFMTSALDSAATLARGGAAFEETVLASYGFVRETASGSRFLGAYNRRFKSRPVGSYPGLGYETIRLLSSAIRTARSGSPAAIRATLARGLRLEGVALPDRVYRPGADHNPVTEVAIVKVSGRKFLPLLSRVPTAVPPA